MIDDSVAGLTKDPFVCSFLKTIDIMVENILDANKSFKMLFSDNSFPNYQVELVYFRSEYVTIGIAGQNKIYRNGFVLLCLNIL